MQYADERGKIFVGGLSWDTTHASLLKYFSRYGEVIDCVVMRNSTTNKSRGFGFVTFKDPACVEMVLTSGPHELDGRQIDPKACNPRSMNKAWISPSLGRGQPGGKSTENSRRKIFIGGLPANITEGQLKDQFSKYGTVTDVAIMFDQQKQRSRGFGFLTFDTEESVDKVVLEHYIHIQGKQVEIKKAEPRDMKMCADAATTVVFAPTTGLSILQSPLANGSSSFSGLNLMPAGHGAIGNPYAGLPTGLHIVGPNSPLLLVAPGGANGNITMSTSPINGMTYQAWPNGPGVNQPDLAIYTPSSTPAGGPFEPQLPTASYNALISPDVGTIYALNSLAHHSSGFNASNAFGPMASMDGGQPDKPPVAATAYFAMGSYGVAGIGSLGAAFGGSLISGGSYGGLHNSAHTGFMASPSIGRFPTNHASASPGFHPYRR